MNQKELSPPVIIAVLTAVTALFVAVLWFGTQTRASSEAFSTAVERQEANPAFSTAVGTHNRAAEAALQNPEEALAARDAFRDQDYQPESGNE